MWRDRLQVGLAATIAPSRRKRHRTTHSVVPSDGLLNRATDQMSKMKFDRNVHCVMGLPIDLLTMKEAVEAVRRAAFGGERCFISTPNLNFAMAARSDSGFRDSVLRSDLSLADGMPLVWVARLLGIPVPERVSGAGLFEELVRYPGEPVTVYFFGGPDGAAEAAAYRVNRAEGGIRCVGFESPGFGTLDDLSSEERIDRINRSGAMFVVVSLGAKKGQQWIEQNRHRLRAPVLCHLGAVVNFSAGTVKRAPGWMQALGAEWLWRILQEPGLWRRYWSDGVAFLGVLGREVLPLWLASLRQSTPLAAKGGGVLLERLPRGVALAMEGAWDGTRVDTLRKLLEEAHQSGLALTIDLTRTTRIGSAALGLLMLARGGFESFEVRSATPHVAETFARFGASYLLEAAN